MKPLRIVVVDNHEIVRRGIRALLEERSGWQVVGEAATGRDAVQKAKELKPDVVVLDISMPDLNGVDAAGQIVKAVPSAEIVIVTRHDSEELARQALSAGARGYVLKSDAGEELVAAVEAVAEHKLYFAATVSEMILAGYLKGRSPQSSEQALTPREREVLQLLAEGKSNKETAAVLGVSVKTVETHRNQIKHKLHLRSTGDLIHYAIRKRIVEP